MAQTSNPKLKTTDQDPQVSSLFDEGNIGEWFIKNRQNILYGFLIALSAIFLIYKMMGSSVRSTEANYIQTTNDFLAFTNPNNANNPQLTDEALKNLESSLKQHPHLGAAYDGSIAQTLINRNQIETALPFANASLERTKSADLPDYADYAQTTLLIEQKNYKEALEKAFALQKSMMNTLKDHPDQPHAFGDELFAFNLLRIAMLQQQLGDTAGELKTWQYWKQYAGLNANQQPSIKINPQAFRAVIQQLAIGAFSLPDYIAYRESVLKQK